MFDWVRKQGLAAEGKLSLHLTQSTNFYIRFFVFQNFIVNKMPSPNIPSWHFIDKDIGNMWKFDELNEKRLLISNSQETGEEFIAKNWR